jgi:HTH-type transcriptional regulator/antitoxin HigA
VYVIDAPIADRFIDSTMTIKPIKTEKDYNEALKRLEVIFDAPIDSKEGDEAEVLSLLIENYENKTYPIEAPDPIEAIRIRMEEMNLKQKDLVGVIGSKSRVSEILNKKKRLTVEMIRELERTLHISASVLVGDYPLASRK